MPCRGLASLAASVGACWTPRTHVRRRDGGASPPIFAQRLVAQQYVTGRGGGGLSSGVDDGRVGGWAHSRAGGEEASMRTPQPFFAHMMTSTARTGRKAETATQVMFRRPTHTTRTDRRRQLRECVPRNFPPTGLSRPMAAGLRQSPVHPGHLAGRRH